MKFIYGWLFLLVFGCMSNNSKPISAIQVKNSTTSVINSFRIPGIPAAGSLFFDKSNLLYISNDSVSGSDIKYYDLDEKKEKWSRHEVQNLVIKGVLISTGEYIFATLSDTIYIINTEGKSRILKIQDRCKITPIAFNETFILQDRGVGLISYDVRTLAKKWTLPNTEVLTMLQPILNDGILFCVFDRSNKIVAVDANDGHVHWEKQLDTPFSNINISLKSEKDLLFLLSSNLKDTTMLSVLDTRSRRMIWQKSIDTSVDVWNSSLAIMDQKIFFKGKNECFSYSMENGTLIDSIHFDADIVTDLVLSDKDEVLVGLQNRKLFRIDSKGKKDHVATCLNDIEVIVKNGKTFFILSGNEVYEVSF